MNPVTRIRDLLALAALAAMVTAAGAQSSAQKASKFYEDGLARYERKEFAAAAVQLKNALQLDNKMLSAHLLLGKTLLAAGELKAAEAALEEALRKGVSLADVGPPLGQVYLLLGDGRKLLEAISVNGVPPSMQADILTLRGSAQAMMGNLASASASFAEARKLEPSNASPLIAEAPVLLRFGEYDKARSAAQKATELAPGNSTAWYQLGNVQYSTGEQKAALASFERALSINAKSVDANVSRASVLMSLGRIDEAVGVLAALKEAKVVEPRASFLRAVLAASRGNSKEALVEYTDAANRIDAMAPGVRTGSEPLLLAAALSHRALGNNEKARGYVDTMLTRNSKNYAGQLLQATLLVDNKDFTRAQSLLEGLLRLTPNESQVLYLLGTTYLNKRQYAQAAEMFERAAARSGNSEVLRELAFTQLAAGQDKPGLGNLEKAFQQNPKDFRAGIELAIYHARHGNAERAVAIADGLVKLDPGNSGLLVVLANIKGRVKDFAGMRATLQQALAKDPKFRPAVTNMSWLDMDEGRLDEARKRLTAYLKERPDDAEVLFQLGLLEQRAGKGAVAVQVWTKADEMQSKDPRPGLALIDALLAQAQPDQALATARRLSGKFPELQAVQHALARAYMAKGDGVMVRQTLQDAVKYARQDAEALVATGRLQLAANLTDAAAATTDRALQARPDMLDALLLRVEVAGKRGDNPGMDAGMKHLNAKFPGHPAVQLTAGHIAMARRQVAQAIGHYKAVFDREPSGGMAALLAQAYLAQNENDKAVAAMEAWTKPHPKDAAANRVLAEVQARAGRTDAARATLQALLAATPDDAALLGSYAALLARMGDPGALAQAERATKLAPLNSEIAATHAALLIQKGDLDGGVRVLRDTRLRDPGNGAIRVQLAGALARAGKKAEAKDELKAALGSANPPPPSPALAQLKTDLGL